MKTFKFDRILLDEGWTENVFVSVDTAGKITSIDREFRNGSIEHVRGYAIPGFQNAHSHAFQYAMAGLAEIHAPGKTSDDFWSWRQTMYRIALTIRPEQLEAIAAQLYAEMLRHGFTSVAEFHYLHHDRDGMPYENLSEMGERLIAAANRVGMKITLVPMFYQKGGFGQDASAEQRRFISKDYKAYYELLAATRKLVDGIANASLGYGIHSLRAVDHANINRVFEEKNDLPFHVHIAEQTGEVDACLAYYGQRPVSWLLENTPVNGSFHLVHATHLSQQELEGIARANARVVLCPSTEGNLGDGLFPLGPFHELNGQWSIGTDSHVGLSPLEELRILDYGQRLVTHQRNQFVSENEGNSGVFGFDMALRNGRQAMGNHCAHYFGIGQPFDAVVIDASHPLIQVREPDQVLPTLIYSGDPGFLLGTLASGKWVVQSGRHVLHEQNSLEFGDALKSLSE